jgi:hypothetical protein
MPFNSPLPSVEEIDARRLTMALDTLDSWFHTNTGSVKEIEHKIPVLYQALRKVEGALRKAGLEQRVFDRERWTSLTPGENLLMDLLQFATGDDLLKGILKGTVDKRLLKGLRRAVADLRLALVERVQVAAPAAVEWSRPESVKTWARVYGIHRNTMGPRLREQTPRNRKVGNKYMVALDDLPANERDKYRNTRRG